MSGKKMILAVALTSWLGFATAGAQPAYPSRPITLIVPFAAGGPTDTLARIVAARPWEAFTMFGNRKRRDAEAAAALETISKNVPGYIVFEILRTARAVYSSKYQYIENQLLRSEYPARSR